VSTFIDVYLGNSTRPLNVDFSRLQHPAPNVDFCRHHTQRVNIRFITTEHLLYLRTLISGVKMTFTNWDINTPTSPTTAAQQCAILSRDVNGRWKNVACNLTKPFVCEYKSYLLVKGCILCSGFTHSGLGCSVYLSAHSL